MKDQVKKAKYDYEYRFYTTPEFLVVNDDWQLYDVFLKYLDNGAFVFVTVFRRKILYT